MPYHGHGVNNPEQRICKIYDSPCLPESEAIFQIAQGGIAGAATSAIEILRAVLSSHNARGFILVHNHPSGNAKPSDDDVLITHSVKRATEAVGLTLLDHIIVSRGAWSSLLDMGLL